MENSEVYNETIATLTKHKNICEQFLQGVKKDFFKYEMCQEIFPCLPPYISQMISNIKQSKNHEEKLWDCHLKEVDEYLSSFSRIPNCLYEIPPQIEDNLIRVRKNLLEQIKLIFSYSNSVKQYDKCVMTQIKNLERFLELESFSPKFEMSKTINFN